MGLKLDATERTAFLAKYDAVRTARSSRDIQADTVVIDVSASCRQTIAGVAAKEKTRMMSARTIAQALYARYTRPHPNAVAVVWVFDSYPDMPAIRHLMYQTSRYGDASPERLANLRGGEIAVGNRIFKYTQRPYATSETEAWNLDTPIDTNRIFSSSRAKQKLYSMMSQELVCLAAEHPAARTTIVDTIKAHDAPNAVIRVQTYEGGDGAEVQITPSPRGAKHGEADLKCSHFFACQHSLRGAHGVWYTCDTDAIMSCVLLGLRCIIGMPNLTVIDPARLPQGHQCAIALLCNGGDYNDNLKFAQISSTALLETLAAGGVPDIMTISAEGIEVDAAALWQYLAAKQPPRRRRNVFVLEGDEPHKFYRMRATAQDVAAAAGTKVRSRVPSGSMLAHTVAALLRSVAYYASAEFDNSTEIGMLDGLYPALEQSFANASAPTNVENVVAAASRAGRVAVSFGI